MEWPKNKKLGIIRVVLPLSCQGEEKWPNQNEQKASLDANKNKPKKSKKASKEQNQNRQKKRQRLEVVEAQVEPQPAPTAKGYFADQIWDNLNLDQALYQAQID